VTHILNIEYQLNYSLVEDSTRRTHEYLIIVEFTQQKILSLISWQPLHLLRAFLIDLVGSQCHRRIAVFEHEAARTGARHHAHYTAANTTIR